MINSNNEKALPLENSSNKYTYNDVEEDASGASPTENVNIEPVQFSHDEEQIEKSNELEEVDSNLYEENPSVFKLISRRSGSTT